MHKLEFWFGQPGYLKMTLPGGTNSLSHVMHAHTHAHIQPFAALHNLFTVLSDLKIEFR